MAKAPEKVLRGILNKVHASNLDLFVPMVENTLQKDPACGPWFVDEIFSLSRKAPVLSQVLADLICALCPSRVAKDILALPKTQFLQNSSK